MNILLIDDHPLTCQGLAALLVSRDAAARVRSVHGAADAQAALQALPRPEWIFLDINLPDDPHHQLFHQLCVTPWIDRTILISAEPAHHLIRTALAAGARGFIPKTAEPELVLDGFARILAGEFYVPPTLTPMLSAPVEPLGSGGDPRRLSPRLTQVRDCLLRGTPNKVIARELNLSAHTVKEYVSSVLAYYGAANRLELVLKRDAIVMNE